MASEICVHNLFARIGLLTLFEQVGKSLFYERLKPPSFLLGERADGLQYFRIDLSGKLLAGLGPSTCLSCDLSLRETSAIG